MYYITINKCILITVNKCIHIISTYFLAAARDKNMHLLTSLYGIAPTFPKRIDFADWSWKVKVMLHERKNVPPQKHYAICEATVHIHICVYCLFACPAQVIPSSMTCHCYLGMVGAEGKLPDL